MVIKGIEMAKKAKKIAANDVDNKFEFGAFAIQNWWKVAVVIAVAGLVVTGFSFKCGNNEVTKDPIYQRVDSKSK